MLRAPDAACANLMKEIEHSSKQLAELHEVEGSGEHAQPGPSACHNKHGVDLRRLSDSEKVEVLDAVLEGTEPQQPVKIQEGAHPLPRTLSHAMSLEQFGTVWQCLIAFSCFCWCSIFFIFFSFFIFWWNFLFCLKALLWVFCFFCIVHLCASFQAMRRRALERHLEACGFSPVRERRGWCQVDQGSEEECCQWKAQLVPRCMQAVGAIESRKWPAWTCKRSKRSHGKMDSARWRIEETFRDRTDSAWFAGAAWIYLKVLELSGAGLLMLCWYVLNWGGHRSIGYWSAVLPQNQHEPTDDSGIFRVNNIGDKWRQTRANNIQWF